MEDSEKLPEEFPLFKKEMQLISSLVVQPAIGLATLFVVIEGILDSRPLTLVSFVEEIKRPLKPNDVLQLCAASGMPSTYTVNSNFLIVHKRRHAQDFANFFWRRCALEYLPTIRYCQNGTKQNVT